MRPWQLLLVLPMACGARTPLSDEDAAAGTDSVVVVDDRPTVVDRPTVDDRPAPFVDVGVDVPVDAGSVIDRPVVPPVDRPAFCGDGVLGAGEQCDRGGDNGPTDAFVLSQPGRPSIVVRPLVRSDSLEAFYRYESASAHTGFEEPGLINHILYVNQATGTLSLVLVAGRDGDLGLTPEQPDAALQIDWTGVPAGTRVGASDDGGEFTTTGVGSFQGRWTFQNNSDGGAIEGLSWDQPWRITARTLRVEGLTRSRFVSREGTTNSLTLRDDVVLTHRGPGLCREDCRLPRCGDGQLDGGERCDDGNVSSGDGCSADCQRFE